MITLKMWQLLAMLAAAVLVGSIGVCMLLYVLVGDDRAERAKARRMRDHRRTNASSTCVNGPGSAVDGST